MMNSVVAMLNKVNTLKISVKLIMILYIDHAGPSGLTHDDAEDLSDSPNEDFYMDDPGPSGLINDDAVDIGENCEGEVYALSKLRCSRRIANCVEQIGQQQWGSNHIAQFVNNREKNDKEDEDVEVDEPVSDFDDEGLEEDEDDNDKL